VVFGTTEHVFEFQFFDRSERCLVGLFYVGLSAVSAFVELVQYVQVVYRGGGGGKGVGPEFELLRLLEQRFGGLGVVPKIGGSGTAFVSSYRFQFGIDVKDTSPGLRPCSSGLCIDLRSCSEWMKSGCKGRQKHTPSGSCPRTTIERHR
jgi:hypothetical protein